MIKLTIIIIESRNIQKYDILTLIQYLSNKTKKYWYNKQDRPNLLVWWFYD